MTAKFWAVFQLITPVDEACHISVPLVLFLSYKSLRGIGNVLLSAVETFITRHSQSRGVSHFSISILSHRPELLAYYQRRGYALTGEKMPFPYDGNNVNQNASAMFWFCKKPARFKLSDVHGCFLA